jgi:hypothetical protein
VIVDVRLWENKYEIQNFRCNPLEDARVKRSMDMNVVHMEKVGYIILPYNMD